MEDAQPKPQDRIFPIVMGFWQARAFAVATDLGIAELLSEGPLDVDQLASRSQTGPCFGRGPYLRCHPDDEGFQRIQPKTTRIDTTAFPLCGVLRSIQRRTLI